VHARIGERFRARDHHVRTAARESCGFEIDLPWVESDDDRLGRRYGRVPGLQRQLAETRRPGQVLARNDAVAARVAAAEVAAELDAPGARPGDRYSLKLREKSNERPHRCLVELCLDPERQIVVAEIDRTRD